MAELIIPTALKLNLRSDLGHCFHPLPVVAWSIFLFTLFMATLDVRISAGSHLIGSELSFTVMGVWHIFPVNGARASGNPDENSGNDNQNENNDIAGCKHDMNLSRETNGMMQNDDCQMTDSQNHERWPCRCNRVLPGRQRNAGSSVGDAWRG